MGRGDPLPVAVPVRDVRNVGGGLPIRVAGYGANQRDKACRCCKCDQEECEASHNGSSIQYASLNEISTCLKADVDASSSAWSPSAVWALRGAVIVCNLASHQNRGCETIGR